MNLTKEQIQKLAPEQREAYGRVIIHDFEERRKLLSKARPRQGAYAAISGFSGLIFYFLIYSGVYSGVQGIRPESGSAFWGRFIFPLMILAATLIPTIQIHLLSRRMDALMDLLKNDLKKAVENPE